MEDPKPVSVKIEPEALKRLRLACVNRGVKLTWAISRAAELWSEKQERLK